MGFALQIPKPSTISATDMNLRKLTLGLVPIIALASCEDHTKPVTVTETRKITTSDEEGNLLASMPAEWRRVPSTKFRDFNCKFGESGEVYVSIGSGDIKSNAERWLKQFGDESAVDVSKLEKLTVFGEQASILEAEGKFAGMRGISIDDGGLLGLLVESRGGLITVKMIGHAADVKAQRENFISFSKSLKWK